MKSTTANPAKPAKSRGGTAHTASRHRAVQREQDAKDRAKPAARKSSQPAQAGRRSQPVNPMPAQHLSKPGLEAKMALRPRFEAPDYKGSGKLEGMAALVTGGDSGIGRAVAVLYAREGADVAIVYLEEDEDAEETRRHVEDEGARCIMIKGDVCDPAFCRDAIDKTLQAFGKLDILVNNAAFQLHAASIEDITDERFDLTLKTNVFGYFQMARAAVPHLGQGASIINTGSVTGLEGSAHLLRRLAARAPGQRSGDESAAAGRCRPGDFTPMAARSFCSVRERGMSRVSGGTETASSNAASGTTQTKPR